MLSSVLFSSILSSTSHTGLQRAAFGDDNWKMQPTLCVCVCKGGLCLCTCVPQLSQPLQLRICCRTALVRRLWEAVWPAGRSSCELFGATVRMLKETFARVFGRMRPKTCSLSAIFKGIRVPAATLLPPLQHAVSPCALVSIQAGNTGHHEGHMAQ